MIPVTPSTPTRGAQRDLVLLPPEVLTTDPELQRKLDPKHVARLAKNYDTLLFGLGHASLRADGRYYALDGQHRCAAAIAAKAGDQPVLFQVYSGLTKEQEAQLFLDLNANKKAVGALDTFQVGVEAGHPAYVDIVRILACFGLHVAAHNSPTTISAVAALVHIYHGRVSAKPSANAPVADRADLLSRTLHVLTKAWGGGQDKNAFDGMLLRGVAGLIQKHGPRIEGERLARAMRKDGDSVRAIGSIRSYAAAARKSPTAAAVEHLQNLYNRHIPADKRLA